MKKELTIEQKEIVVKMRDGWQICVSRFSRNQFLNKNGASGDDVSDADFDALADAELLDSGGQGVYHNFYTLTELGKSITI